MVKIGQKFVYSFLFFSMVSIASDYQCLKIVSHQKDICGNEINTYSDGRTVKKSSAGDYTEKLGDGSLFLKTCTGDLIYKNANGGIVYKQTCAGSVTCNGDNGDINTFKQRFLYHNHNQNKFNVNTVNSQASQPCQPLIYLSQQQVYQQQFNQRQPLINNNGNNNGGTNVVIGSATGSTFNNIGNVIQQQNLQLPQPQQSSVVSSELTLAQISERDTAITNYEKIIKDVNSNISYNKQVL